MRASTIYILGAVSSVTKVLRGRHSYFGTGPLNFLLQATVHNISGAKTPVMIKRNRKKIYLTSSPHPPARQPEPEEEELVPVVPITLSFDQSVKLKSACDETQYLKAPRIIFKDHGLAVHGREED